MTAPAPLCDIDRALADPKLLGAALGDPTPWAAWRAILRAAFGLPLDDEARAIFDRVAGGRQPPPGRVEELWVIAGRRGGKSRMAAALASFLAAFVDHRPSLAAGERGHVLCLAASRSQARTIRDYAAGFLMTSPILKRQVRAENAEEIELDGRVSISVHSNSFRTIRGRTLVAAIFDEAAYWRDESSASPDIETYRAVLPALATTGGMLVGISSPYRRAGLLFQRHRDAYGVDDPHVLVVQAGTEVLNPTINRDVIARARKADLEAARAEWDAEFRSDLSALLDDALVDEAVDPSRPIELPPREGLEYVAFTDASAGRHDAFTIAIAHKEDERAVIDAVRGVKPPFDPSSVAGEFAALALDYRCGTVVGDSFSGEWVASAFRDAGVEYRRAEKPKSQLYLEALPVFARGAVSIPDHPQLLRELRLLERRTSRSGRDSVDHPTNGTDDFANAVAGALDVALARKPQPFTWYVGA